MRLFHRSFTKVGIPVKYSEGFNPHPKFSIANPLSLGIESEEEYMDVDLDEEMPVEVFIEKMNKVLPQGIKILDGKNLAKEESISSIISWAFYEIKFEVPKDIEIESIDSQIKEWLCKEEILISRLRKKGKQKVMKEENIRNLIGNVVYKGIDDNSIIIDTLLKSGDNGNLRPMDFIEAMNRDNKLNIDMDLVSLKRIGLYAEDKGNIFKPL